MPTLRPDDPIDLQIHTTSSDGQWQPAELFAYLAGAGFRVIAITDHDRVDTTGEMAALGAAHGIVVIPATEISANWHGLTAHLLCYAPVTTGFTSPALAELGARTVAAQFANTRAVHDELLRRGNMFPQQAEVLAEIGGEVTRPIDNARLLVASGAAPDLATALAMIADAGYRMVTVPLAEAVDAAHTSGALAILGHPGRGGGELHEFPPAELEALLAEVPLDGIEARYPTYTPAQVETYLAFAAAHSLLVSVGSDSHGPHQRLPVPYSAATCAALLGRLGIAVAD